MRFDGCRRSESGPARRIVAGLALRPRAVRQLAFVLVVSLLLSSSAFGQARKHRSITWEKFKASGPELKQIGWLAVRHAKDIESSSWSVGCETLDRDQARFSVYKDYVGELGVKHARLQSGRAKCEKQKGVYGFAWLDECVYGLNEQGVEPWMCLCYGNPIYGSDLHLGAGVAAVTHNEEALAAWLKYVEATVSRYKDTVNRWEVWNEPNGHGCEEYATLLMRTAETIKEVQPDAEIMGLSLAGVDLRFTKGVLEILKEHEKLDRFDYLTYHPYTRNPDSSYTAVDNLRQLVEAYSPQHQALPRRKWLPVHPGMDPCPLPLSVDGIQPDQYAPEVTKT